MATAPRLAIVPDDVPPPAARPRAAWAWRERWPLVVAIVVPLALVAGLGASARRARDASLRQTRATLLAQEFAPRRHSVEQFFTLAYQTVRTIGLLPSVRHAAGGNRRSEAENVVATGRFSAEGDQTVQQLYNNLASNVSVSEVYCVLDGFDRRRGEVPFFMYDQLVLGAGQRGEDGDEKKTADTPDEYEEDEYAYYPKQIAELKAAHPAFDARKLDDIPAVASPVMRTCDNTQYVSKSRGDVANANGFLYSVPFYDPAGRFRGIVSAIFRTNVLEAQLLGVPFLVVTDADRAAAASAGVRLPEHSGNFVIANPARGLWIGDRRDPGLVDAARTFLAGARQDDGRLHAEKLAVTDSSPWWLVYRYDPVVMQRASAAATGRFGIELFGILAIAIAVLLGPVGIHLKKRQVLEVEARIREIAAGGGDLTRRLDIRRRDEVGQLGRSFDGLLDLVHDLIARIKGSAQQVAEGAHEISRGSEALSTAMQEQAAGSEQLALDIARLSGAVRDGSRHAHEASALALATSDIAATGGAAVDRSREAMAAVLESSRRIGAIVTLVEDIAFQTNMLALNAAVEAARAGEHGRGFAVVAAEVRSLADRTGTAAREIHGLVDEASQRTGEMHASVEQSGARLVQIASAVRDLAGRMSAIAGANEAHAGEIGELTRNVSRIDSAVQGNSAIAEESASVAHSLADQAGELRTLVERFVVRESASAFDE